MITACTLTLIKASFEFKNVVRVTKSVKENNTFRNHCILFISMNVVMVVAFVIVIANSYSNNKSQTMVNVAIMCDSTLSVITGTYIALRLISLSRPPESFTCPVTNGKMHALTKVFADRELVNYMTKLNVSHDE